MELTVTGCLAISSCLIPVRTENLKTIGLHWAVLFKKEASNCLLISAQWVETTAGSIKCFKNSSTARRSVNQSPEFAWCS